MDARTEEQIDEWDTRPFPGGYDGLHELADQQFSGAVRANDALLFMLNGRIIGIFEGTIDDFADAAGTAHQTPHPSLPLLFTMREQGGSTEAKYYTNDTPISEVDDTLTQGSFTGYLELSENVLSGDYYLVFYGGRSMSVAFVGNSEELVTDDEAYERADDEVGIYEVVDVDVSVIDIPEPADNEPEGEPEPNVGSEPNVDSEPAPEPETNSEPEDTAPASEPEPEHSAATETRGMEPDDPTTTAPTEREPAETDRAPTATEPDSTTATEFSATESTVEEREIDTDADRVGSDPPADPTEDKPADRRREDETTAERRRSRPEQSPIDRSDSERSDSNRSGREQPKPEADRRGDEQRRADQRESSRSAEERHDAERRTEPDPRTERSSGSDRLGADRSTTDRDVESRSRDERRETTRGPAEESTRTEQPTARQPDPEHSTTDRPVGEQPDPEQQSADRHHSAASSEPTTDRPTDPTDASVPTEPVDTTPEREPTTPTTDRERAASVSEREPASQPDSTADRTTDPVDGDRSSETIAAPDDESDETHDRFESEAAWQETIRIPSIDPDRSDEPTGSSADPVGSSSSEPSTEEIVAAARADQPTDDGSSADFDRLQRRLVELETENESLRTEREELRETVEELEAEIEELEARVERLQPSDDGTPTRELSSREAISGTDVFVRYGSKGEGTLENAHAGDADGEEVNANLRLEHHTQFDADAAAIDGEPYEEFLERSMPYRFAEWIVRTLLYEIVDTGNQSGLAQLYDVLPEIDRADLKGDVTVEYVEDGEEYRDQLTFDVVLRDRMGNPLLVASLNDDRNPATKEMMTGLLERAERVKESHDELGAAFLVTASFFAPAALETASEATSSGFLSSSSKKSWVKLARKTGFHLCLVESRNGEFHINVPEL